MRFSGRILMLFFSIGIGIYVILSAQKWPPRTALFPEVIGAVVVILALVALFFNLFRKGESGEETDLMDFRLSKDVDQARVTRRVLSVMLWVVGFLVGILLLGFPITALFFMFLYLKCDGREGWKTSVGITAIVWAGFYVLFIWLLKTRFNEGWIIEWFKGG